MTTIKEVFQLLVENQQNKKKLDLHFPEAENWMWDHCLNLGKFTDSKGVNYDLGVHFQGEDLPLDKQFVAAIVYGNKDGSYKSGDLDPNEFLNFADGETCTKYSFWLITGNEHYIECYHRLKELIEKIKAHIVAKKINQFVMIFKSGCNPQFPTFQEMHVIDINYYFDTNDYAITLVYPGILIGRNGETIDAIQKMVNAKINIVEKKFLKHSNLLQ